MSQTKAQLIDGKVATVEFSGGSASAPSIAFSGDTNTGIYSPGADQVAISTNGAGRLFVDASGNVGVGISPSYALHVSTSSTSSAAFRNPNAANTQALIGNTAGDTAIRTLSTGDGLIFSDTGKYLAFGTNGASERLRITSAGLVGIGTSSPTARLTIAGGTADNYADGILLSKSGGNAYAIYTSTNNLEFRSVTGSKHIATFDYDGRVGIGSTAPSTVLDISGSVSNSTTANLLTLRNQSAASAGNIAQMQFFCVNTFGGGEAVAAIQALNPNAGANNGGALVLAVSSNGTATTPSERARLTSSGQLLVGTSSSPTTGNGQYAKIVVQGLAGQATSAGLISVGRNEGAANITSGEDIGFISFDDSSGNTFATINATADANAGSGDYPGRLVFSTTADGASSPTERMRINAVGQANTYSTDANFSLRNSNSAGTTYVFLVGLHSATSTVDGGTISFRVYTNGNVQNTNNSYGAISDVKLKENIVDAASQWDDIKALQVRKYNFKEETGQQTHTQIGLIAQEVELVSPGLVSESPDRDEDGNDLGTVTKSVNYSVLYMKAVKALQEAMERIEHLESEMAEVKAQLS